MDPDPGIEVVKEAGGIGAILVKFFVRYLEYRDKGIVRNQDARVGMLLTHDDTYIPVQSNASVSCKQDLTFSVGDDVHSRSKGRNRNINRVIVHQ